MSNCPKFPRGTDGEAALYRPVERFLESRGYEVKGEVEHCDGTYALSAAGAEALRQFAAAAAALADKAAA